MKKQIQSRRWSIPFFLALASAVGIRTACPLPAFAQLKGHTTGVLHVAFYHGDKALVSVSKSEVILWDDLEYDHALVRMPFADVVSGLCEMRGLETRQVLNGITGRWEWIEIEDARKAFVAAPGPEHSLVWLGAGDTAMLEKLSLMSREPVSWAYVDEPTRSWAYLEYHRGRLTREILDPEQVWRTGITTGDMLMGKGERDFPAMTDFLRAIEDRYEPPDTIWNFPVWNNPDLRDEYLERDDLSCAWSLEVIFRKQEPTLGTHGDVPAEFASLIADQKSGI